MKIGNDSFREIHTTKAFKAPGNLPEPKKPKMVKLSPGFRKESPYFSWYNVVFWEFRLYVSVKKKKIILRL